MTDPSRISGGGPKWTENPLHRPNVKFDATERFERVKSFRLEGGRVTLGDASDAPRQTKSFGRSISDFFKSIGAKIARAFDFEGRRLERQEARGVAMSGSKALPGGFKVEGDGTVDCKFPVRLHDGALKSVGLSDHAQPTSMMQFMEAQANAHSDTDRTVDLGDGRSFSLNGEIARDFGRMKIEIPTDEGPYVTREESGVPGESQLPQSCKHLLDFAGDAPTAQVISSFINQYTIRNLGRALADKDGNEVMSRPPSAHAPVTVTFPGLGEVHSDSAPQLRDAHWKLSKTQDGNVKIELSWPSYVQRFSNNETFMEETRSGTREMTRTVDSQLTLPEGHALKQTITMTFELDGAAASNGQIRVVQHDQPMIHFQGKVDVNATMSKINQGH